MIFTKRNKDVFTTLRKLPKKQNPYQEGTEGDISFYTTFTGKMELTVYSFHQTLNMGYSKRIKLSHAPILGLDIDDACICEKILDEMINKLTELHKKEEQPCPIK